MIHHYTSTRDTSLDLPASQCILQGISEDGGLFVSSLLEQYRFDASDFVGLSYQDIANNILSSFLDDYSEEEVEKCINQAYNTDNFDTQEIFPLTVKGDVSFLELYHGKTQAFKDAALSLLPYLMRVAADKNGASEKIAILAATSGDTGKAALESFANKEGFSAISIYPYEGVSKLQLLQMLTQEGDNAIAAAIKGNFDTAQSAVKDIFSDQEFNEKLKKNGYMLSSANSINIGRLLPQIVYYYYSYAKLLELNIIEQGEKINFAVPSGNFGDILAGYYALRTGLPIRKLILASNENKVLSDFFKTGMYDRRRSFVKTISPSMDIIISSNLERLLFSATGYSDFDTRKLMQSLSDDGYYSIDKDNKSLQPFFASSATEEETKKAIKLAWDEKGQLIDTHTACAYKAWEDYKQAYPNGGHTVILSTASPFKFPKAVFESLYEDAPENEIEAMKELAYRTGLKVPAALDGIDTRKARNELVLEESSLREFIFSFLMGNQCTQ